MKRRNFFTAIGTLAIGSGTALGTGAFDATSSSSDGVMSVVTQGADAPLDIQIGDGASGDTNVQTGSLYTDEEIDFHISELPKVAVVDPGQGMVNLQVFGAIGSDTTFSNLLKIVNYDSNNDYDVGFQFTEYGTVVPDTVSENEVTDIFEFKANSSEISATDGSTPTQETVTAGSPVDVTLEFKGTNVPSSYADSPKPGNFSNSTFKDTVDPTMERDTLVKEVTAVADHVSE
jgi:hypothetical protein